MASSQPALLEGESRGLFSARFAPPATARRELFCWCIGIQLLVLLLALAGSEAGREVKSSVTTATDEFLVPITEFSPASEPAASEPSPVQEPAPAPVAAVPENLTELPEPMEAVAAEDVPMPDPAPASGRFPRAPVRTT